VHPVDAEQSLSWTYNPWRADWRKPALALLIEVGVAALAGLSTSQPGAPGSALGWSAFALLLLLGMTATIFTPVSYRLDEKGVSVRFVGTPSFRRWEHYRNYYVHKPGVHLTTMPQPSALDPFRGHMLMFDGNREAVVEYIARHIVKEQAPAAPDSSSAPGP